MVEIRLRNVLDFGRAFALDNMDVSIVPKYLGVFSLMALQAVGQGMRNRVNRTNG
jgi:hypothetical protein